MTTREGTYKDGEQMAGSSLQYLHLCLLPFWAPFWTISLSNNVPAVCGYAFLNETTDKFKAC